MTLDELKIVLGLDSSGVKKGMKEAESTISSGVSSLMAKFSALGAAVTAAFSFGAAFQQYAKEADAMGKLADALDVDISKMHAWGEATARAGGSVEAFQSSLQSLTGQLARQATVGTSRTAKLLEGAGIDAGEIGRQRDAFAVMMDLAEKSESMGKAEFFGLGRSLGLDQGTIMLLQQGRAALKEQIRLQKELGVYTKEDAKVTADWNDRVADFGQTFKTFSAIIFRMVLPAFTKFIEYVNKAISFLRKHERFVQAFFIGLAAVITTALLPALAKLAAAMLANPVTWFIAALAGIALVIEDLIVWAEDGESALSDLWASLFGSPAEARSMWEEIKKAAQEFFDKLPEYKEQITSVFEAIGKYNQIISAPFRVLFEDLKKSAGGIEKLKSVAEDFIQFVVTWNETLSAPFTGLINILKQASISVQDFEDVTRAFFGFVRTWNEMLASPITNFIELLKSAKSVWDNTIGKLELPSLSLPSFGGGEEKPQEAHAEGGIFNAPHVGLVAEDGAEAIIPLSSGKRNRAYELLSRVASAFGVKQETPAPIVNVTEQGQEPAPIVNVEAPEQNIAPAPVIDYASMLDELQIAAPKIDLDGIAKALNLPAPMVNVENEAPVPQMPTLDFGAFAKAMNFPSPTVNVENNAETPQINIENEKPQPNLADFFAGFELPEINLGDFAKGLEIPPQISATEAMPPSVSNTSTNNTNVDTRINEINVYTQATDAEQISKDIGGAIDNNWTAQANVGIAG